MIAAAFFPAMSIRVVFPAGSLIWESFGADARVSDDLVARIWVLL